MEDKKIDGVSWLGWREKVQSLKLFITKCYVQGQEMSFF